MENMAAVLVIFRGVVQGVNFRRNLSDAALRLGLKGWVRNLPDGTVEAFIQGDDESIRKLLDESRELPNASVTDIKMRAAEEQNAEGFWIRR